MTISARGAARFVGIVIFASATMVGTTPSAFADPPPGCSAGDLEQIKSEVSAATSVYLFSHPDVNAYFSSLRGQSKDQVGKQIKDYLAANPQTQSELGAIRQPLHDMKARCQ
jgi:hemophore-related protein